VPQAKVFRAVLDCRTAALGGHCLECDTCGHRDYVYHSCRNRHCPNCQTRAKEEWSRRRMTELLPVPYAHLVFTLPHVLNPLATFHDRWLYDTLMASVAATLSEFARNPRWLGAEPAFTLVLHTWTQDLRRHIHVHVLIACGGLDAQGNWAEPKRNPRFLFPIHGLSRVFRAKFLDASRCSASSRQVNARSGGHCRGLGRPAPTLAALRLGGLRQDPLGGPAEVLDYLSRYTIVPPFPTSVSSRSGMAMRWCACAPMTPGEKRVIRIPEPCSLGRFLQHVLPPGFKRIRHYGLLSSAHKRERLSPGSAGAPSPCTFISGVRSSGSVHAAVAQKDISRCPCCEHGTLRIVASCRRTAPPWYVHIPSCCRAPPAGVRRNGDEVLRIFKKNGVY